MDVSAWLKKQGLETHAEAFAENGVDAGLLPELTNEDLKDLGVSRLADRKRLLRAIEKLSDDADQNLVAPSPVVEPSGERRQVTVLFADLAGYTRLASELGAEETHAVLNRYFEMVDAVVESYGGKVDKHIGDNVMAVFGAPVAHDDDPMRAICTALDIHERMTVLSGEAGRPLLAHIGIASGQVVASGTGSDAHREYTVIGDSVNLAARLQDKAEPGETLISAPLRRAVTDGVDCEFLGDVALKGIDPLVQVWRVKSLRAASETSGRVAFVGRRAELAQLAGIVEDCRINGNGHAIVVRGEAGIGKTRLVEELTGIAAEGGFEIHKGLVLDFGVGRGSDAVRSVVSSLLEVQLGGDKNSRQAAVEAAISRGLLSPEQRVFLNDLLDLPQSLEDRTTYDAMENATRNEGKRTVVADLMRRVSQETSFVAVVEDVHWANSLMLTYLARMAATVAECSALLIMTSRVEGDPLDQAWRGSTGGCPLMTIDLGPLRKEDALELTSTFVDLTNQFALDCIKRAEGNPLFLEQLLRNAEELGDEDIPASIQSLVLARIDRLSSDDKEALLAASALGQRFSLDALRHLIGNPRYICGSLVERHLVRPERDEFLFAHALVQEGVYTSLLTARRRELHRSAAEWYGERDLVLRAEHLDRADDPGAAAAYLDAAEGQTAAFHFDAALSLTDRGIELAEDTATKCDLICLRGDALRNMGATEESIATFEMALGTAHDDARRCRAWIGMAEGLRVADRHASALEILEKADAVASRQGLTSERAQIHYLRGNVYFPLGNIDGCLREHEKALSFAREVGSPEGEALALSGLGDAYYLRGHMQTACEKFRACIEVCHEYGYGRIEVANRHMVGWTRIHLMEFAAGLEDALESAKMAAEVNHHRAEVLGLLLAGQIELETGRFVEAQEHLERSIELARKMSASNFKAQGLLMLARLSAAQGRQQEARDFVQRATGVVREIGMTFIGPAILAVGARLTEDARERKKALQEAESILDSGCVAHNHFWFAQIAIEDSLAKGEWEEVERYATRLESYTREQPMAWPDFTIARGRALAAWGRGEQDTKLINVLTRLKKDAEQVGLSSALPAINRALASA
jgi:class 3 adenylate cyclase/tetratricopeptide (TPR) repeat protein